ncbi:hypothetical protein [Rubripirellula tenax]|nr:hypothetical protein [Rubripirellula tenax]
MPSGDAQRAWFPEMLEELTQFWTGEPDWLQVVTFCQTMTSRRSSIRNQRGIRDPMMTCRNCGGKHAMILPPISPRSLLFALQKIDIITNDELKQLDKQWKSFRKEENLDAQGQVVEDRDDIADRSFTCSHTQDKTS